jgi:fructan beta-fructosidase
MHKGKQVWVLLVSINPGGPNGGSATQYFTGSFDGKTFAPDVEKTKFIDYGTDNYAGITWSNTGARKIFIGWMNNWQYANVVPTQSWRGAATIPRELTLNEVDGEHFISSVPVKELEAIQKVVYKKSSIALSNELNLSDHIRDANGQFKFDMTLDASNDFQILLSNKAGQELIIGYDHEKRTYYIDRTKSGKSDFEAGFAKKHTAPRISKSQEIKLSLVADVASVELFADNGLSVMTDIFFPDEIMNNLKVLSPKTRSLKDVRVMAIQSIHHSF